MKKKQTDFLGKNRVRHIPEYVARISRWSVFSFRLSLLPLIISAVIIFLLYSNEALLLSITDFVNKLLGTQTGAEGAMTTDSILLCIGLICLVFVLVFLFIQLYRIAVVGRQRFEFYSDVILHRTGRRQNFKKSNVCSTNTETGSLRYEQSDIRTFFGVYSARVVKVPAVLRWIPFPYLYRHLRQKMFNYGDIIVYCPGGHDATMRFISIAKPHDLAEYLNKKQVKETVNYGYTFNNDANSQADARNIQNIANAVI